MKRRKWQNATPVHHPFYGDCHALRLRQRGSEPPEVLIAEVGIWVPITRLEDTNGRRVLERQAQDNFDLRYIHQGTY